MQYSSNFQAGGYIRPSLIFVHKYESRTAMTVPEMSSADKIPLRERNVRQILPEIARSGGARRSIDTFYDLKKKSKPEMEK